VLAEEYGLDSRFEVCWLSARQWARRYDYAWQAVWQARGWRAEGIFTRLPQAAALASLLGKTTFFEAHDLPRHAAAKWFRLFLLGKGARRTIAISQALANDLLETFPTLRNFSADFLLVLGDGVDLTHYTPLLSPLQARQKLRQVGWELPDGFIAGYTGHLYRGRGSDMMIALADALREVHFLIVGGEIEQCHSLMQEFKARGLTNYTLTGPVIPLQVPLFQMASNVLLMPYQAQVAASSGGDIARYLSPLKLFEYLASARPILASDLAVFREILTDENAILLPPQELGAWEAALVMLLRNPQRCSELAEGARHTAEQHTWERRAERILSPA
jgi:glycosyltransferase involved in cell wall biosynthesis